MAKYGYNVDTQTKLLDQYNQFSGGLKTVDTDDSLQGFYLRQAENVSISEFGFLEKRYGLVEERAVLAASTGKLQGYFEYVTPTETKEFVALGGKLYINGTVVDTFDKEDETNSFPIDEDLANTGMNPATGTFQADREIDMVRIDDVLYIFTGSYPLYFKNDEDGNVYLLPFYFPTFNEIAQYGNGFNLLVNDQETQYYGEGVYPLVFTDEETTITVAESLSLDLIETDFYAPRLPYINAKSGTDVITFTIPANINLPAGLFDTFDNFYGSFIYGLSTYNPKYTYFEVEADPLGQPCVIGDHVTWNDGSTQKYYDCPLVATSTPLIEVVPLVYYRKTGSVQGFQNAVDIATHATFYSNSDGDSVFYPLTPESNCYVTKENFTAIPLDVATTTNMQIGISELEVGAYDFRVIVEARMYTGISATYKRLASDEFYIENFYVSGDKLVPDITHDPTALWTCNNVIKHYDKLMAWGSTTSPEYIFISDPTYKNWFPDTATIKLDTDADEPIVSVTPFMQVLIAQTARKTWGIKGTEIFVSDATTGNVYEPFDVSPVYGAISRKSVRPVRNRLFFLSTEGLVELNSLYAVDYRYNVKEIDRNIKNIVPRDVNAVAIQHDYQYWINFPSTGETFRYYIDKEAWVKDTYGKDTTNAYDFDGIFQYKSKDGILTMITLPTNLTGLNQNVFKIRVDKTIPSDFNIPIKTTFETAYLNQGYPFHPKKYLENKLDFTLQNEYNSGKEPLEIRDLAQAGNLALFTADFLRNHTYTLDVEGNAVTKLEYQLNGEGDFVDLIFPTPVDEVVTFSLPYLEFDTLWLRVTAENIDISEAVLKDVTYDLSLDFNIWAISEEGTLNLDNIDSYTPDDAVITTNLGTTFGNWIFDESAFDNRVTAVRTVKLSGRGYNFKLYFTDRTKSKWTLENLGITYKMKRARGNR